MHNANQQTAEQRWKHYQARDNSKIMARRAKDFMLTLMDAGIDFEIYWEWPLRCHGWHVLQPLQEQLRRRGHDLHDCVIAGCRYDMRSEDGQGLLGKMWKIKTTSQTFHP